MDAEPTGEEYEDLRRSVQDPDGRAYDVFVHTGYGGAGPAFLGADERAPRVAHMLVNLVNRTLGRLPRKPTSFTFPIVYVLRHTEDGDVRQVQMAHTSDRAEAEAVIADVLKRIESGAFVPEENNGL